MSEKISDIIKAINELKPDRFVIGALTLCIVSALFKWVLNVEEYQSQIHTIATIIFYLMLVFLIVLLAVYIHKQLRIKNRELERLRDLTLDERKFLSWYIKTGKPAQPGSGIIPEILREKGIVFMISMIPSSGRNLYTLDDRARKLLLKYPSLLDTTE